MIKHYDVIIEPFRPGVMEKLNLGPEKLCEINPRLIYARLTGFGQTGKLAARAGHDINYVAISGILSMLGGKSEKPTPPVNLLADFAGGGLICAFGIAMAILERERSGKGQVIDSAMIDGAAYVSSWILLNQGGLNWNNSRGKNRLDGGYYNYDTYETKDGQFMAVGCFESKFFENFKNKLELPQIQLNGTDYEKEQYREMVRQKFFTKTQKEWTEIFSKTDACVHPILPWQEAYKFEHNKQRENMELRDGLVIPRPAPYLMRTPGKVRERKEFSNQNAISALEEIQMSHEEIKKLIANDIIILPNKSNL